VREYITLVRECLRGEPVTFDGDFYEVRRFRLGVELADGRRPRIILGALNPKMLRLGGEVADGVLLNYLPAAHVPWSIAQVRAGGDATVYANVHVAVAAREDCIDAARRDLFPTPLSMPTPPTSDGQASLMTSTTSGSDTLAVTARAHSLPSPIGSWTAST
jgi:alkanesulfonate monooxygenase SsuD/methylene tetrahydromethanopterin reductase-like flavin-dependent oxidoreductase (luciferase family)